MTSQYRTLECEMGKVLSMPPTSDCLKLQNCCKESEDCNIYAIIRRGHIAGCEQHLLRVLVSIVWTVHHLVPVVLLQHAFVCNDALYEHVLPSPMYSLPLQSIEPSSDLHWDLHQSPDCRLQTVRFVCSNSQGDRSIKGNQTPACVGMPTRISAIHAAVCRMVRLCRQPVSKRAF